MKEGILPEDKSRRVGDETERPAESKEVEEKIDEVLKKIEMNVGRIDIHIQSIKNLTEKISKIDGVLEFHKTEELETARKEMSVERAERRNTIDEFEREIGGLEIDLRNILAGVESEELKRTAFEKLEKYREKLESLREEEKKIRELLRAYGAEK